MFLKGEKTENTCFWFDKDGKQLCTSEGEMSVLSNSATDITIYAWCWPKIFTIALDNQGAHTIYHWGIYEKYNTGWYSDEDGSTSIKDNKISIPARQGYDFKGFYTKTNGSGEQIID